MGFTIMCQEYEDKRLWTLLPSVRLYIIG